MPLLHVRCAKCGKMISTGVDVDFETFKDITGLAEWARIDETYGSAGSKPS